MRSASRSVATVVVTALVALGTISAATHPEVEVLLRSALKAKSEGKLQEAWATFDRAIKLARAGGDVAGEARVLRHRGITALHQGDGEQGIRDLGESVRLFEAAGDLVEASTSRLHLVTPLDARGERARADEQMRIAERVLAASGDEHALHFAGIVEARRLMARDRHRDALPRLEKAEAYYNRSGKLGRLADTLSLKAYALQKLEAWEASRKAYRALLDIAFRSSDQAQIAYAYCNLGDVERHLGSPQIAGDLLDRSIDLLDQMRARIPGGPEDRVSFLDTQVDAYHRKIALLVDAGNPSEALELAEHFQARAFLEAIEASPASAPPPASALEASSRALIALQRKMFGAGLTESERHALRSEEARWTSLAKEARRDRPGGGGAPPTIGLPELQRRIPPRTAFLRYWVHPRGTMLWVVRARGAELIQIPVPADELESAVRRYLDPIRDRTLAEDVSLRRGAADHIAAGAELHRLLIAPARRALDEIDVLIVVPDAMLWYLPFEALVVERPEPWPKPPPEAPYFWEYTLARFLGDDYRILYAPSATAWARLLDVRGEGRGFVSFAPFSEGDPPDRARRLPPLPSARTESTTLAALFTPGEALLGSDVSEPNVRGSISKARYVHFAAHGYLHRERPDLSGIVLWDGLLQAHEIKGLRLRSELVSLAVCNSALGQFSRGEGLLGLGRAFLTSGARNVVVSLWPAHDPASAQLMRAFYEEIARGRPLSHALQIAKRRVRAEVRPGTVVLGGEKVSYAHPYYWAGYVQIGSDGRNP